MVFPVSLPKTGVRYQEAYSLQSSLNISKKQCQEDSHHPDVYHQKPVTLESVARWLRIPKCILVRVPVGNVFSHGAGVCVMERHGDPPGAGRSAARGERVCAASPPAPRGRRLRALPVLKSLFMKM